MSDLLYNFFNPHAARVAVPFLLAGLRVTLEVSIASIAIAVALGLTLAIVRRTAPWPVRWLLIAYVDVLRGIPPVVLLVLVYFALPAIGINLPVFAAAVTSLGLYGSAYAAEIFRGAFEGVSTVQWDAGRALGLSPLQTLWYVIVPQAFRIAIPPLTNEAIALVKLTSVGFVIGLPEVLGQARQAEELTANITPLMTGALVYLVLLLILSHVSQASERQLKRGMVRARL